KANVIVAYQEKLRAHYSDELVDPVRLFDIDAQLFNEAQIHLQAQAHNDGWGMVVNRLLSPVFEMLNMGKVETAEEMQAYIVGRREIWQMLANEYRDYLQHFDAHCDQYFNAVGYLEIEKFLVELETRRAKLARINPVMQEVQQTIDFYDSII